MEAWSAGKEQENPSLSEEKREWFAGVCQELGLDPAKTTLFDYLEADDKVSFAKK